MTFRSWVFTEMAYPFTPPDETVESVRVTLPSRHYDPDVGSQLYKLYLDLYRRADELGLDVMINEHHATATCLDVCAPLILSILARETDRARLLILGNPIANRAEPVRVAEEMAMCDVLSRGRIEVGFVRGVPQEILPSNVNPALMKARFWEAADLIIKAWTEIDGPFNWEGEFFHARQVNVWPRIYQSPHPPIWIPTQSPATVAEAADRQYQLAVILNGHEGARKMFEIYRSRTAELELPEVPPSRLGYLGLVFVGATAAEAQAGAEQLQWYLLHNKVAPQFLNPPGYLPASVRAPTLARQLRGEQLGSPIADIIHASIDELVERGMFFAGTPDDVVEQIKTFYERVGGFGHLLMMMQAGLMTYDTASRSMELFAAEVYPRLKADLMT